MRLGLAQLPQTFSCSSSSCSAASCTFTPVANYITNCSSVGNGVCGSCATSPCPLSRQAAYIVVPAPTSETNSSNYQSLFSYIDEQCTASNGELISYGDCQPFNGLLRGIASYLQGTYTDPISGKVLTSPLNDAPACKSVHIALVYRWSNSETFECSERTYFTDLINQLSSTGITVNGKTFKIKVTLYSYYSSLSLSLHAFDRNVTSLGATVYKWDIDTTLSAGLSSTWLAMSAPDTCNNLDDDCDGEVDEDYPHYCNLRTDCCTLSNRTQCLTQFVSSISAANPRGDVTQLPCTSVAQSQQSSTWLCSDPGEQCNGIDDNCDGQIDEGFARCGSPLHCPTAEVCNGLDDDCNGLIDDGTILTLFDTCH